MVEKLKRPMNVTPQASTRENQKD